MNHCENCSNEQKLKFQQLDQLREHARTKAADEGKAWAICQDEVTGLFIIDADTAIRERFQYIEIVSGVQQVNAG